MSEASYSLQSARGFQLDRGKNYVKKNYAFWFGIAQTRKSEGHLTILRNYRLKDFEKLIDRQGKISQTYAYYNRSPDVLWLINLNENLAKIFLLRLLLITALYFEISLENISSHAFGKIQQNHIRTMLDINRNSDIGWFLRSPFDAEFLVRGYPEQFHSSDSFQSQLICFSWQLWLGPRMLPLIVRLISTGNHVKFCFTWQLLWGLTITLPSIVRLKSMLTMLHTVQHGNFCWD